MQTAISYYLRSFLTGIAASIILYTGHNIDLLININCTWEIVVGFRTRNEQLSSVETFETVELPNRVRNKPEVGILVSVSIGEKDSLIS